MSLLNLATLAGFQVNRAGPAQKLAFCCTIICYFTSAFLWRRLAERNYLDPRYLLLCMTMNKSVHKMLIHGTLCPLSGGKNVNWTTTLQAVSSVKCHRARPPPGRGSFSGYETLTESHQDSSGATSLLFLIFSTLLITPLQLFTASHQPNSSQHVAFRCLHPAPQ